MRYLILLFALISVAAFADDSVFDREFSKFDKDFERLNSWKTETPASKKLKRASTVQPAAQGGVTTPLEPEQVAPDSAKKPVEMPESPGATDHRLPEEHTALPKGVKVERLANNDRLGNQISDPAMRNKVQALYKRPDVVVQQYVLPTN